MRKATIISVTTDRQLKIPPEIQEQLNPGDEYLISVTDDVITFQKIQKPLQFDQLQQKIDALGPGPNEMSLEEISTLVKDVRQQIQTEAESAG
ncbi:hypothetical protein IQ254_18245 [Nodosilinea sp. LEGE 07088]|uniref:hypothetical protein n=1 Tax=Nodosilinea sp. LEGE 07088 TaxID=2777968 RepID=UPI001882B3BF|nr:hypothetical protein [Nodosilinea sp. LEGE 07088]MBE9139111.1 hypothetical protein [Nodosilinea sp. LEGE 07088]